jgi:hypothetical protein
MPLAENALTTLEAVKEYLKIPIGTTVDDTKLEDLINSCSTAIENYCGRKFKEQSFDEECDGTGTKYILLEQYPVKSINTVSVDDIILDSSEYKFKKNNGVLIRNNTVWPRGDINTNVSYIAGLSEIPADLELACRHFVMSFFKADVASFSTTFSEGFVFRPEAMPAQVKALVSPYKKVV